MTAVVVDRCMFTPTLGGSTDWVVSSAVQGYLTPLAAGVTDGQTVAYVAESTDKSQWELGTGVYTTASTTIARTTILKSSNSNAKVTFSAVPNVYLVLTAEYLATIGGGGANPGTPPTIVQFASSDVASAGSVIVTFGSTPVSGNLMIAMGTTNSVSAASGWTQLAQNGGGAQESGIFYRIAGSSEPTSQTPCTGSGNGTAVAMWEIHGANVAPFVFASATVSNSSPFAATASVPGLTNVLALAAISGDAALATFSQLFNITQNVNSAVSRGIVAGHSNGSLAVAQLLTTLSSSVATRSNIALLTT